MTKEDIKARMGFEYSTIANMIFMLTGRDTRSRSYSCGYNPHKMEIYSHGTKGFGVPQFKREIQFNEVHLSYQSILVRFNNSKDWISIDLQTGKFYGYNTDKVAQLIFGKYVTPSDVLLHTKTALRELLEEYTKQIKEVLDRPWFRV